jgi:ABC-type antimicrobial peptide transport system permease subunit
MALGAKRRHIASTVAKQTVMLVGTGVLPGLLCSFVTLRTMSTMLYGVSWVSVRSLALCSLVLCAVAAAAALGPVYRASSINPNVALRQE